MPLLRVLKAQNHAGIIPDSSPAYPPEPPRRLSGDFLCTLSFFAKRKCEAPVFTGRRRPQGGKLAAFQRHRPTMPRVKSAGFGENVRRHATAASPKEFDRQRPRNPRKDPKEMLDELLFRFLRLLAITRANMLCPKERF